MVINGFEKDNVALRHDDLTVQNCESYAYLGAVFTEDGCVHTSVKEHLAMKQGHVANLNTFSNRRI